MTNKTNNDTLTCSFSTCPNIHPDKTEYAVYVSIIFLLIVVFILLCKLYAGNINKCCESKSKLHPDFFHDDLCYLRECVRLSEKRIDSLMSSLVSIERKIYILIPGHLAFIVFILDHLYCHEIAMFLKAIAIVFSIVSIALAGMAFFTHSLNIPNLGCTPKNLSGIQNCQTRVDITSMLVHKDMLIYYQGRIEEIKNELNKASKCFIFSVISTIITFTFATLWLIFTFFM